MLDEDRNVQLYGYTSDELSSGSHKPIVRVCDGCGTYQVMRKQSYSPLCRSCAVSETQTGHTISDETREKMSIAHSNPSEDTRNKMRAPRDLTDATQFALVSGQRGKRSHNWKGGITPIMKMLRESHPYKNWREAVFERDDYTCKRCNARGGNLEAHHILPVRDHKNDLLLFDVNNGITLCVGCHKLIGNREYDYAEQFNNIIGA